MPDGALFPTLIADTAALGLCDHVRRAGWECAVVLADEYRDRLTLQQIIAVEIASRSGPERIETMQAGAMIALFVSVVEVRV